MTNPAWWRSPHGGLLWIGLLLVGVLLLATSVPGIFIVDEDHHIAAVRALASGQLSVPEYDGLNYSAELAFFDPSGRARPEGFTTTTVPPLYPVLALPFYGLGLRGLVILNILGFLACALMVFFYARKHATRPATPWLALVTFLLAGYSIEYAQGLWPHMLAVALCTGGVVLASRVKDNGKLVLALLSGLLCGLAAGVRYQNIIFAGAVGLGLAIWARRRVMTSGLYLLGVAGPLLASSIMNFQRYGSWNPISKGAYYLKLGAGNTIGNPIVEGFHVLWTKVVDFSAHPPIGPTQELVEQLVHPDPNTGAFLLLGKALKKAWLQSSPWILLALVAMLLAWRLSLRANFDNQESDRKARELRSMFIIVGCMLGAFALAGFQRYAGLCFNQRYFLELVPLAAVAVAWLVEARDLKMKYLVAGVALGVLLAVGPLLAWNPTDGIRQILLQKLPLLLAGLALAGWVIGRKRSNAWLAILLGACLSWSAAIHIGEDLAATNFVRSWRKQQHDAVASILPPGKNAVFAYWGYKDGLGPLQIDRDVIIADPWIDEGQDAKRLTGELLSSGRRIFVLAAGMPKRIFDKISEGRSYRLVSGSPYPILEVAESP